VIFLLRSSETNYPPNSKNPPIAPRTVDVRNLMLDSSSS